MSPEPEPGHRRRPAQRPSRPVLWIVCGLALAGLIVALARAFPDPRRDTQDWWSLAYLSGLLVLITAGAFRAGRVFRPHHLRYIALWGVIAALIALAYAYRAELGFADAPRDPGARERNI